MKRRHNYEIQESLNSSGYYKENNCIEIPTEIYDSFKEQSKYARYIFNGEKNDKKRKQMTINSKNIQINTFLKNITNKIVELVNFYNFQPSNYVLLYSKAGCSNQLAHSDYIPSKELEIYQTPLNAIIALESNTKLHIWNKSINIVTEKYLPVKPINRTILYLNKGDILLFRGDLIHAGSDYDIDNIRLHLYLDNNLVPRLPNRTFVISKHAKQQIKKIIIE